MNKPQKSDDGTLKAGTSRRSRLGRAGQGGTMPRIMMAALLVVVAGGAALFWPRGGSVPTGIGENQTTVKAQESLAVPGQTPRSGDVDIDEVVTPALTPEKAETADKTPPVTKPAETVPQAKAPTSKPLVTKPKTTKPETTKPKTTKPKTPEPKITEPKVEPTSQGSYAVQVGAFGEAVNADTEAARLKALGWDTRVRAGNNSSGDMVFRVWIGYFANRQLAQTFINQNSRHLGGAIPVHR